MSDQYRGELNHETAANVMVYMKDSSDHRTGKASLTLTINASKDGAAFAAITPTVTERGNGWYNLALTSSHTDTLGPLALRVTGTDADDENIEYRVRDVPAEVWAETTRALTDLDGFNLHADYDAAKTAASQSSVDTIDGIVDAIQAQTDLIPASPAASGDIPSASSVAGAVLDELLAGHADAGSAGEALGLLAGIDAQTDLIPASPAAAGDVPTTADIVAAILDHTVTDHSTASTVGKALIDAAAPGGDTALLKLIANLCSQRVGATGWDGAQSTPLAISFTGTVSAGTMTLYAAPSADLASKVTLGTWDGATFTKDAGWTGEIDVGHVLYFETGATWSSTAGTMTVTVKTAFLGTFAIAFTLPVIAGEGAGFPTGDGGIQYEEGGLWKMLPAAVAGSGTIWDALLTSHVISGSFGERVADLAREATMLAQLVTGVVQNRVVVNPGGAIELYSENVQLLTFNLGSDHDLTGRKLFFCVKADPTAANNTAIINGECTITDAANGTATYTTSKAETATVGAYYFDLTSTDSDGSSNPRTEAAGDFTILQGVRRN